MSIYERFERHGKGKTFANRWPKFYVPCGHKVRMRDGNVVPICPACKPVERRQPRIAQPSSEDSDNDQR